MLFFNAAIHIDNHNEATARNNRGVGDIGIIHGPFSNDNKPWGADKLTNSAAGENYETPNFDYNSQHLRLALLPAARRGLESSPPQLLEAHV